MDSGNNGSLHSSSGPDEEFDSPSFFHPSSTASSSSFPNLPPPPLPPLFFDSLSFLNSPPLLPPPHPPNLNSLLNLDYPRPSPPPPPLSAAAAAPPRNSKKRSRASRRAPTTVLTTDTSNFRAMVQEFTGIPSPPFPSSSSLFHFFRSSSSALSPPPQPPQPPPFLLRPFPQKLHSPTFTSTNSNYQLPSSSSSDFYPFGEKSSQPSQIETYGLIPPNLVGSGWPDGELRPVVGHCKLNYTTSAVADFNADKGTSDSAVATTRGEGMVESWICSSD